MPGLVLKHSLVFNYFVFTRFLSFGPFPMNPRLLKDCFAGILCDLRYP